MPTADAGQSGETEVDLEARSSWKMFYVVICPIVPWSGWEDVQAVSSLTLDSKPLEQARWSARGAIPRLKALDSASHLARLILQESTHWDTE